MDPRPLSVLGIALLVLAASALADCPYTRADFGPYDRITIHPAKGFRLVNEPFTIQFERIDEKTATPISRSFKIYYQGDDLLATGTLVQSGKTDSKGEYVYTPKKPGRYRLEAFDTKVLIDVMQGYEEPTETGAVCGNGICEEELGESVDSCPADCAECGNDICEETEDKGNCPEDCIVCGDGVCDSPEYWPTGCSCLEDCLPEICGDGVCSYRHGENTSTCPDDCPLEEAKEEPPKDHTVYYIIIAVIGGALLLSLLRGKLGKLRPKKGKPKSKKAGPVKKHELEDDKEVNEIVKGLLRAGVSEKRIMAKLLEYGLTDEEAYRIIDKHR